MSDTIPDDVPVPPQGEACALVPRRRHAAGADPSKRDQILDGARQVFFDKGFDAASLNDICRAAGVSKGTIYVYFSDKVDLFETLIARERERLFSGIEQILDEDAPLADRLRRFGRRQAEIICSDHVIQAQRIIIGSVERMPEMGARFYDGGAQRSQGAVLRLFEREIAAGRMVIADPALAAYQFSELTTSGLWRPRLFGKTRTPPTAEAIARSVEGAVAMIIAAYVPKSG